MRVVVYHRWYGCETGCCGHAIAIDPPADDDFKFAGESATEVNGSFKFKHPYTSDVAGQLEFAKQLVRQELGDEHVVDLDWSACLIVDC